MSRGYPLVVFALGLTIFGQLMVKWRVDAAGAFPPDAGGQLRFVFGLLIDPWIILAMLTTVVSALAYFAALTDLDLSRAYPVLALSFVGVVLASAPLYGEALTGPKLVGVGMIIAGVVVASRG